MPGEEKREKKRAVSIRYKKQGGMWGTSEEREKKSNMKEAQLEWGNRG